jgi:hypothetical protein
MVDLAESRQEREVTGTRPRQFAAAHPMVEAVDLLGTAVATSGEAAKTLQA